MASGSNGKILRKHSMKNPWYNIKNGVLNLIKWVPVIWQDRDWDYIFIYRILYFKLKEMEKYQRRDGIVKNHKKIADQIRLCVLLLNRLLKDEYLDNAFINHDKKWGNLETSFKDKKFDVIRGKVITEEDSIQERKESKRLYEHSDDMSCQDSDMLFERMNKHIQGWWD